MSCSIGKIPNACFPLCRFLGCFDHPDLDWCQSTTAIRQRDICGVPIMITADGMRDDHSRLFFHRDQGLFLCSVEPRYIDLLSYLDHCALTINTIDNRCNQYSSLSIYIVSVDPNIHQNAIHRSSRLDDADRLDQCLF